MKICIVTTAFPRWNGDGWGSFIFEAARALQHQGLEVRVIAMHCPGSQTRENWDGIQIIRTKYLPERWEILRKDSGGLPEFWKTSSWARLAIFPFLLYHALNCAYYCRDVDVIHANWTLSAATAWFSKWVHRRPIIVTVQGSDIFQAPQLPFISRITRIVLSGSDEIIALSKALAEATFDLGVQPLKVSIIPNGVNLDRFPMGDSDRLPIILFVGSLIVRKGIKYLILGMPAILDEQPEARLVLIGEGRQKKELQLLVKELNIKNVVFTGQLSPDQVGRWMRQARVFVLPSIEEGQGVVLLEAMASGTPCIGSSVGGISDVINSEVGIIVPPEDSNALANAICKIFSDNELWEKLSINSRKRVLEHYDWNVISKKLVSVYMKAIYRKG